MNFKNNFQEILDKCKTEKWDMLGLKEFCKENNIKYENLTDAQINIFITVIDENKKKKLIDMPNKYAFFTDDEIYVLSRQAIEASWEITMTGKYNEPEVKLHSRLMNELVDERRRRGM